MRNASPGYLLVAVCAIRLVSAGMVFAAAEARVSQNSARVLSVDDVLVLAKAKTAEDVITNFINNQEGRYALTAKDIVALKNAGVSDRLIAAMQNKPASGGSPVQPSAGPASAAERAPVTAAAGGSRGAAQQANIGPCQVIISAPLQGAKVGAEGRVRGTAKIPAGTHLWVLAHMKDLAAEWWPQGGREALINADGTWVIITGYGQPRDSGEQFEVAAVVVNEGTHSLLKKWFDDSVRRQSYPPIPFPDIVQGCGFAKVTVTKSQE